MRLISPITTLCIRVEDICSRWLWCRYLSKDVAIRAKYPRNLQNWSELGRLDSEVVWTTKNTKIQNSCSELADALTTAGLNQKVSRNTNSWELLSHKSCSPVSASKDSNNVLISELKPNTLYLRKQIGIEDVYQSRVTWVTNMALASRQERFRRWN